jgi:chaperone BCS1
MIAFLAGLITQFRDQLATNQFLVGMLTTGMLGAGAFLLRSIPARIGRVLWRLLTIEVTFRSDEPGFDLANEFVLRHVLVERLSRVFILALGKMVERDTGAARYFQPGYGNHIGWYRWRLVFVHRKVERDSQSAQFKEEVTLTLLTRNKAALDAIAGAARDYMRVVQSADRMRVYTSGDGWWQEHARIVRRSLDTVFVPAEVKDAITGHLDRFLASEDAYLARGIPYHTGVFLSGPPGTGKSSLIHAIASRYSRSIRYLNLGSVEGDGDLISLLGTNASDSILVIEDIDVAAHAAGKARRASKPGPAPVPPAEAGEKSPVTLSSLLNVLDGLLTPHGLIVIATANRPDLLDVAMVRKGRFDLTLELGPMRWSEFKAMATAFGHNVEDIRLAEAFYRDVPAVEARNLLLDAPHGGLAAFMARDEIRVAA